MIAVDTKLLVYAHQSSSAFHDPATHAIESLCNRGVPWAIPWPCVHEFISVTTNPKVFKRPASVKEALDFLDVLEGLSELNYLSESAGYMERLREVSIAVEIKGGRIHDARIAALCLHHGVSELWSADRDFSLFPRLKVRNPLATA